MKQDHIPGFPKKIPINSKIHWQDGLPTFGKENGECPSLHVIKFHLHNHGLGFDYPEDFLMKMFMLSLEEMARIWYEQR